MVTNAGCWMMLNFLFWTEFLKMNLVCVELGTDLTGKSAEARPVSPNSEERDALKVKRSELRLYCDLLMQQVHAVKDAADRQPGPDIEVGLFTSIRQPSPAVLTFLSLLHMSDQKTFPFPFRLNILKIIMLEFHVTQSLDQDFLVC